MIQDDTTLIEKPKWLVVAFATNLYVRYVPFYIYSILYFNKMHNVDFLIMVSKGYATFLNKLKTILPSCNIQVVELDNDVYNAKVNKQKYVLHYRFLLEKKYYINHDYVFIGDVDVLICNDIFSKRVEYMKKVSYCNKIRKLHKRYNNIYRFNGVHSFKVKEYLLNYYKNIEELTIAKISELKIIDEQTLYYVLKDNTDEIKYVINNPPPLDIVGGLHLGELRKNSVSNAFFKNYLPVVIELFNDPLFINISSIYFQQHISIVRKFISSQSNS